MKAIDAHIDSDELGFELHITDDEGRSHIFNVHDCAEELYDSVKASIGPWLYEMESARRSRPPARLTDAEHEEEARCAALGMEGPNAKQYRYEQFA